MQVWLDQSILSRYRDDFVLPLPPPPLFLTPSLFLYLSFYRAAEQKQTGQSSRHCSVETLMKFKPYSLLQNASFQADKQWKKKKQEKKKTLADTMRCLLLCWVLCLAKPVLRPRIASDKNRPVTLVSEATGCSHTCAAESNYNPVKHLMKCHSSSVCFIRNMSLLLEMSHILPRFSSAAVIIVQYLTRVVLSLCTVSLEGPFFFFFSFLEFMAVVNIDFVPPLSPQAPPLKRTAITVPSISTARASLWSLSMMASALTWWVTHSI